MGVEGRGCNFVVSSIITKCPRNVYLVLCTAAVSGFAYVLVSEMICLGYLMRKIH